MPSVILFLVASLMGAAGVLLAAASAHAAPNAKLDVAGYMLLFHAAAVLGGVSAAGQGLLSRPLALVALAGFMLGAALFAGDLAMRAFAGTRLFPMAAPGGGLILIASWLALALAALMTLLRDA
jgi:uncharacterized membrane protein YgdD (TMEM256/DUF423 family)